MQWHRLAFMPSFLWRGIYNQDFFWGIPQIKVIKLPQDEHKLRLMNLDKEGQWWIKPSCTKRKGIPTQIKKHYWADKNVCSILPRRISSCLWHSALAQSWHMNPMLPAFDPAWPSSVSDWSDPGNPAQGNGLKLPLWANIPNVNCSKPPQSTKWNGIAPLRLRFTFVDLNPPQDGRHLNSCSTTAVQSRERSQASWVLPSVRAPGSPSALASRSQLSFEAVAKELLSSWD